MARVRSGNETEFWRVRFNKTVVYWNYYEMILNLALSAYKWENLPDTVDARYLELLLNTYGRCLYFNDDAIGYLVTKMSDQSLLNIYDEPIERMATANNGYHTSRSSDDSVILYNNLMHTPSLDNVAYYAYRLAQIDDTISINVNAQKTPILITGPEDQRLALMNVYKKYEEGVPRIFGNKSFDPKSVTVLKTDAPYLADNLYQLKVQTWNEMLTYFGIPNQTVIKRERVNVDEVNRAMGGTLANRVSRLTAREQAVEKINTMFGTNISVAFNDDIDPSMPDAVGTDAGTDVGKDTDTETDTDRR